MRQLTTSILIDAPPERVWAWLEDMASHYTEWHPDHMSARWERGEPNRVGSTMTVVEVLGGHREVLRFELTRFDPPRLFRYRIRGLISLLLPDGAFCLAPDDGRSRFTATISYRFGRFTERLFGRRMEALVAHMREEGENVKRLVEAAVP